MPLPKRLIVLLALVFAAALPAVAQARINVAVGIGDQGTAMFTSPHFRALQIKKVRYFVQWDAISRPAALLQADAFVAAARAAHEDILMHISTNDYRHGRARLPTVAQYKRQVGALVRRYRRLGVSEWGVWNEANHVSEPTYRSPKAAARFFQAMEGICKGCTIVALDVLDQSNGARYLASFYRALPPADRARAKIIGIHNYSEVNRFRSGTTQGIIRTARHYNRHVSTWLTETGGLVKLGRSFRCSKTRAAKATDYMFRQARALRGSIRRLYVYQWTGTNCLGTFDAGLVNANGTVRPSYKTLVRDIRAFVR